MWSTVWLWGAPAWGFGMVSDFSQGLMDPLPRQQEVYVLKESLDQLMYRVYFLGGRIVCWAWPRDRLILLVMLAFKTSFMTQVLHTQGLRRRHGGRFACCRAYGMKGWWPANFHNLYQQVGRCWEMLGVWTQMVCGWIQQWTSETLNWSRCFPSTVTTHGAELAPSGNLT